MSDSSVKADGFLLRKHDYGTGLPHLVLGTADMEFLKWFLHNCGIYVDFRSNFPSFVSLYRTAKWPDKMANPSSKYFVISST